MTDKFAVQPVIGVS